MSARVGLPTIIMLAACASPQRPPELTRANGLWSQTMPECGEAPHFVFVDGRYDGFSVTGIALITGGLKPLTFIEAPPQSDRFYDGPEVLSCGTREALKTLERMPEGCYYPDDCGPREAKNGYWLGRDILLETFPRAAKGKYQSSEARGAGSENPRLRDCIEFDLCYGSIGRPPQAQIKLRAIRGGPVQVVGVDSCRLKDDAGDQLYAK